MFQFLHSFVSSKTQTIMKRTFSIVCIKNDKADKEGYLFLRRKGRENRTKKTLGIRVPVKQFDQFWDKVDLKFKSGMPN